MANLDPIYCLYGESGSGKTKISEELIARGFTFVNSYTTRPRRRDNEMGHIFIDNEQAEELMSQNNVAAYNNFGGFHYFALEDQVRNADFYIIDSKGIDKLIYNPLGFNVIPIYIKVDKTKRYYRLREEGLSIMDTLDRLNRDKGEFYHSDRYYIVDNNNDLYDAVDEIVRIVGDHS